jgi:hypothetical protein
LQWIADVQREDYFPFPMDLFGQHREITNRVLHVLESRGR